jgi:hypothetical protein
MDIAYRILDNPLLGNYLMRSPKFQILGQTRDLRKTIIDSLSYDNQFTNDICESIFHDVDRLLDQEIVDLANRQIIDFHKELGPNIQAPDVRGFFKLTTFGEFDPQQYFLSRTLGLAHAILEAMINKNLPNISQRMFDIMLQKLKEGYLMLRATEIVSRSSA